MKLPKLPKAVEHERYVEVMGKQPPPLLLHPVARWQWEYRGAKKDREALAAALRKDNDGE